MNRKGIELAISTLIIMAIGIALLVVLIIALTGGFTSLKSATAPFGATVEASAVREACNVACSTGNRITYCCDKFQISGEEVKCSDERLELSCGLTCEGFSCNP